MLNSNICTTFYHDVLMPCVWQSSLVGSRVADVHILCISWIWTRLKAAIAYIARFCLTDLTSVLCQVLRQILILLSFLFCRSQIHSYTTLWEPVMTNSIRTCSNCRCLKVTISRTSCLYVKCPHLPPWPWRLLPVCVFRSGLLLGDCNGRRLCANRSCGTFTR
jgi:hypothetical protein